MSRSIIKKAAGIASSTLLSRFFAYFREILTIQFLGVGVLSDAFFLALRVPSSLRKIFAEGALSSVLVPAFIRAEQKNGADGLNRLLTLSFVMIELLIGLLVIAICYWAGWIVHQMAPGASVEYMGASVTFLRILAPFILFLSSSAILSAVLQATHRFLLPGLAAALLNCMYVFALCCALYHQWSVETLCWSWIFASFVNFIIHLVVCIAYRFDVAVPDRSTWKEFFYVMVQLVPCIVSVGIGEVNFWIDSAFASYLQVGTLSLLRCAYQLINIPLGVIATSLAIVLLPHFSKMGQSRDELGLYLSEAISFVTWMIVPIMIVMMFCSREIFETMFLSDKFTMQHVIQAQANMNAYLAGLLFYALEKVILNAFYALQSTGIATFVVVLTIGMNFFMNKILMSMYGGMGLALATSISAGVRIMLFVLILSYYFGINFHAQKLYRLLYNYAVQLAVLGTVYCSVAMIVARWIATLTFSYAWQFGYLHGTLNSYFFLHSFGYWIWFGPLTAIFFAMIYGTRRFFGVSFSYLN